MLARGRWSGPSAGCPSPSAAAARVVSSAASRLGTPEDCALQHPYGSPSCPPSATLPGNVDLIIAQESARRMANLERFGSESAQEDLHAQGGHGGPEISIDVACAPDQVFGERGLGDELVLDEGDKRGFQQAAHTRDVVQGGDGVGNGLQTVAGSVAVQTAPQQIGDEFLGVAGGLVPALLRRQRRVMAAGPFVTLVDQLGNRALVAA